MFFFQHDPEQCTPGGEDGNFIMFARATSGDKRNNNKFSSCSLRAIEPVLNAKARSAKGCFTGECTNIVFVRVCYYLIAYYGFLPYFEKTILKKYLLMKFFL